MKQMISGQINQPVIIRHDTEEIQQIQKEIDSKQQILTINDIPVVGNMSTENVSVDDLTSISCIRVDTDNGEEQHRYDIPDINGLKKAIDDIDIPDNTKIFYGVALEMPPSSGKYAYYVSDNNTTQISHIYTAASIIELFNELKNIKIYISQFHDESETTKKIMLDLVQVVENPNNPLCYFIGWLCSDGAPKQLFGTMSFYTINISIDGGTPVDNSDNGEQLS